MEKQMKEGIVLKSTDYKESSKILQILTSQGKISLMIKGAKKMNNHFRFLCFPFNVISFIPSKAKFPNIIDGDLINDYHFIKEDLTANLYGSHMLEIAYNAVDSDIKTEILYPFLIKCLDLINNGADSEIISFIFELKMLHLLGVGPNFKTCSSCGKEELFSFSIENGGILCGNCAKRKMQNLSTIVALYYVDLSKDQLPEIDSFSKKEIRKFIDSYYDIHVGIKTKSHLFFSY